MTDSTFDAAENKCNVSKATAEKIAKAIGKPLSEVFEPTGKTKLSEKTIQLHHTLISSILSTAVEWQVIFSNPCDRIKRPKVQPLPPSYLDEEETKQLLEKLEDEGIQNRTMIYMLVFLGLRRGELVGLKWQDIDFENSTITVDREVLYSPGKGVYVSDTKTSTSHRITEKEDPAPEEYESLKTKNTAAQVVAFVSPSETEKKKQAVSASPSEPVQLTLFDFLN